MVTRTDPALTLRIFGRAVQAFGVETVGFCLPAGVISSFSGCATISGRTLGVEFKQTSLGDHQIRQIKQGHQLRRVLGQSAITRLLHSEAILDDVKGMFDLGADLGFDLSGLIAQTVKFAACIQRPALACPHGDVPANFSFGLRPYGCALVAGITGGFLLVPIQQRLRLRDVVDVGRSADHGTYESRLSIDADVRLHAKVPLVTLLGLMHLGVPLPFAILGQRWRGDDRGVDDGTFGQHQAFLGKVCFDCREDALGRSVCSLPEDAGT